MMATVGPVALPAGESIRLAELGDISRIIEVANYKTPLGYRNITGLGGKRIIASSLLSRR
ncbi:hypothetical protein [Microvirga sp. VF16]|uniref:hypothetical protein n=1 Tax=Microvirga sp. VF16 TaxID=2807101 RepID=UPI00193CF032|nr:hypothetical protein [Microvirga sp. VF16]QRM34488.1 hypothetical protein JO965_35460 [Microvirga sp. VF16]